jgi:cysteine synthase
LDQLPGPLGIDAFCSYVGTAGCFLGTVEALRQGHPGLLRVVVEPAESAVLSGGAAGVHHIEGGGIGRRPPMLGFDDYDEVVDVPEADAFAMARRAAREYGLFAGPSTGANLVAASEVAQRLAARHRVVTVQVDSGLKYLNGSLFANS